MCLKRVLEKNIKRINKNKKTLTSVDFLRLCWIRQWVIMQSQIDFYCTFRSFEVKRMSS